MLAKIYYNPFKHVVNKTFLLICAIIEEYP